MDKQKLIDAIHEWRKIKGYTPTTASQHLMGSGVWLRNLEGNAGLTLRSYERIKARLERDGVKV